MGPAAKAVAKGTRVSAAAAMVISAATIVVPALPAFRNRYAEFGSELPAPTQFVVDGWLTPSGLLAIGIALGALAIRGRWARRATLLAAWLFALATLGFLCAAAPLPFRVLRTHEGWPFSSAAWRLM